ncbi:hypothetical protein [Comamonas piscis]|nr:hypothetical protein [Comamonas piscis]WSO33326.1 hypothetical protein VUJ63_19590 [Comamonas piscis]
MAHVSVVNGAGSGRKAQQGRKASGILNLLPAGLLAFLGLRRRA